MVILVLKKLIMKLLLTIITLGIFATSITSCKKEGCTDPTATNYDADSNGKGTCVYEPVPVPVVEYDLRVTVIDSPTLSFNSGFIDVLVYTTDGTTFPEINCNFMNDNSTISDFCTQTMFTLSGTLTEGVTYNFDVMDGNNNDVYGTFVVSNGELTFTWGAGTPNGENGAIKVIPFNSNMTCGGETFNLIRVSV